MEIEDIVLKINQIKPSEQELKDHIEDGDYVDYLLNSYEVEVEETDSKLSLIENLVLHTSFGDIDFAGITFNSSLEDLIVEGKKLKVFAMFQENQLCFDDSLDQFYYIDLYNANNQYIVVQCNLIQDKLIESLLCLMELDIKFTYKGVSVEPNTTENLTQIAGHPAYKTFFNIILSQYQ